VGKVPPVPSAAVPDTSAVEVTDLRVTYGDLVAVDGVSFSAGAGEVVALLGPNGAGKTSSIETLEGYRRPADGQVRVLGLDPRSDHAELSPRIGVMLQEGGLYPGIRVAEVVRLFAAYYPAAEDPEALLERVGLAAHARAVVRRLSGGQKQRLALALALVGRPAVAFLDEPTAGLDVDGRRLVREVVAEQRDRGTCVLLATHDLAEAEKVADRVVIVDRGRVVADGTPAELMAGPGEEIRFAAPAGLEVDALAAVLGAPVTEDSPGEYRVAAAPDPATVAALTAWLAEHDHPLGDLRAGRQHLEDVFLRLTRDEP
jgi:ABC-2 type transport system ATP-binding protein